MEHDKPHHEDERTLRQLREILSMDRNVNQALDDAYHLGRIRGRLEGAQAVSEKLLAV